MKLTNERQRIHLNRMKFSIRLSLGNNMQDHIYWSFYERCGRKLVDHRRSILKETLMELNEIFLLY